MPASNTTRAIRNPEQTRKEILLAAFHAMHRNGFQGTSLTDILATTGLTKGALYHHFPTKKALGYAVVDEVIRNLVDELWLQPVEASDDPITAMQQRLKRMRESMSTDDIRLGCPLNNLAQEMSPIDEEFRRRLNQVFDYWVTGLTRALRRGQKSGHVRRDVDPRAAATFIVAAVEGCMSLAKNAQASTPIRACSDGLMAYLESLRA